MNPQLGRWYCPTNMEERDQGVLTAMTERAMTLKLNEEEYEALKRYAAGQDRSMSWVIKRAVREKIGLDEVAEMVVRPIPKD